MTWQPVFETRCDVFEPEKDDGLFEDPELRSELTLGVDIDSGARKARIRAAHDGTTVSAEYSITNASVPDLSKPAAIETVELKLDLSDTAVSKRLAEAGTAGLGLSLAAKLDSVTLRLRGPNDGGFWTSDAPFFAIFFCWKLTGEVAAGSKVLVEDATTGKTEVGDISGTVTVEPIVCAGFSSIQPFGEEITPADLQVRLDLESLGLTTGWQPLLLIDDGWASPFHMNGLGRWFGQLADAIGKFPNIFKDIDLPDWDLDFDADIDLPFGLAFRETQLSVSVGDGGYRIKGEAKGLILRWGDAAEFEIKSARLRLELFEKDGSFAYQLEATLFETKGGVVDFALPFDVLSIGAACWRFRFGLHASGTAGAIQVCPEVLIELGGAEIRSSLSDGGADPLHKTDLRLLMRNFTVMFAEIPEGDKPVLFEEYKTEAPFKDYANEIPALSFAEDLNAPPPTAPANDYGIEITDGDVRKGERFFIAWKQRGNQLLKALAHDLTGGEPAGQIPDDAEEIEVALELAWFGEDEDRDTQLRLDWKARDATSLDPANAPGSKPVWKPEPPYTCAEWEEVKRQGFSLPIASGGVNLKDPIKNARLINLPGMALEVAEPKAHSVVIRREAAGETSVGYLLIYDAPTAAGAKRAGAIARARFGFSLTDPETGKRETMETDKGEFATMAVGYGGAEPTALRVIGWTIGQAPRLLEAFDGDTAIPMLIPNETAGGKFGCPEPKPPAKAPVSLGFDSFRAPSFDNKDAWRMSLRFAAEAALFKLFGGNDANKAPVSFRISRICLPIDDDGNVVSDLDDILIETALKVQFDEDGGFSAEGLAHFRLNLSTLSLTLEDDARLGVSLATAEKQPAWAERVPLPTLPDGQVYAYSTEREFLNLKATFLSSEAKGANTPEIEFLRLTINDGRFKLALPEDKHMVVRFDGLGNDSLNFWVDSFEIGPGGLDLEARLASSTLNVKGLKKPFALKEAGLRIRESRLETLSIAASGALPELFDDAPVDLSITFIQHSRGGRIELDELICELGKKGTPVFSRGTRFKFEIVKLDLRYQRPSPEEDRHFFFEVTGSAEFAPDPGEFNGGLLEDLKAARIEFVRAPLTDEFAKHIQLVVELNEPKSFGVYNLFKMEIRSIGFAPHFDEFDGPAIVLGGQMEFADVGDVIAAEIDFHSMYIGLPKQGEVLPQLHFDGLRVEISSPEGFKIAGRVDRYDSETLQGFGGEGTIQIPGFPELSAAFAFVKLRGDETERFRRGWFVAIEAGKISYQMGALPIYLRQIGLGFGYRYTLPLIREFEQETTLRELIDRMLKALDRHQTLARLDSWVPDPEKPGERPRWTIALEAVFTLGTSQVAPFDYNARKEQQVKTIIAQILAAIRSDFTLLAAAKVWFPVSVDDFFENEEGMRNRPLARGFMVFSVPQKRFLAHAAKGKNPYLGKPNDPVPDVVKNVLNNSHFEATMLIEPGLLHAELGWPDRLMFRMQVGSLMLECRGGVLFRAENDVLIHGIFFSARGSVDLAGGVSLGFVGFRVSAQVRVYFATRLMSALYLSRPLDSKIYAQVGLDVAVRFSVQAWLRIKIGFCKINITISFSFELQIVIGLDVGWAGFGQIGFRGRATVVLTIFGRRLSARVAVGLNDGAVERARIALKPYMTSFLEPGEIPPVPDGTLQRNASDGQIEDAVLLSETPGPLAIANAPATAPKATAKKLTKAAAKAMIKAAQNDEFVTSHIHVEQAGKTLVWIMPGPGGAAFYPPLSVPASEEAPVHYATLRLSDEKTVWAFDGAKFKDHSGAGTEIELKARPNSDLKMEVEEFENGEVPQQPEDREVSMTLQQMLAGCYAVSAKDYVSKGATSAEDRYFPQFWPDVDVPVFLPKEDTLGAAQKDPRIKDPGDPARGPRRQVDPQKSDYDAVLVDALEAEDVQADAYAGQGASPDKEAVEKLERQILAQAEGNQTYLLQTFYDDLVKMAEFLENGGELGGITGALDEDRPTILDTGMVLVVDGAPPDWAVNRTKSMKPEEYPSISFNDDVTKMPAFRGEELKLGSKDFALFPIVDFETADFAKNRPLIRKPVIYFDEEIVALSWELKWPGVAPEVAAGAENGPEHFMRHYRVNFLDLSTNQPLGLPDGYTCLPCDLAGQAQKQNDDSYARKRLESRYKITVPTSDLFPEGGADRQALRRISATVVPIGQTGGLGVARSFTLSEEPTFTPLPPDASSLVLFGADARPGSVRGAEPRSYFARLGWRKLSLTSGPGVARTDMWDIVLRPLEQVPMGAYPNDASDVTQRGLMSQTGQSLAEGDVIIRLEDMVPGDPKLPQGMTVKRPEHNRLEEDRDAADTEIELLIDPERSGFFPKDDMIRDHLGQPALPGSYPHNAAKEFFSIVAGDSHNGRGWRVFLRAVGRRVGAADGGLTYSGLVPLQLLLHLPEKTTGLSEEDQLDKAQRPLPHFEWPSVPLTKDEAALDERRVAHPGWSAGAVHIPVPEIETVGSSVSDLLTKPIGIRYRPEPGRSRAVTLNWSAVQPDPDGSAPRNYASISEYALMRASLDDLVNADLIEKKTEGNAEFEPNWQRVARILPSDRQVSQQTPDTMNDAQNWAAWLPADVARTAWMNAAGIPRKEQVDRLPGWFTWAESELIWPDPEQPLEDAIQDGRNKEAEAGPNAASPLERLFDLEQTSRDKWTPEQRRMQLAAWADLGHKAVGRALHPYLALVAGRLAATQINGFSVPFEVQASNGKPVSQTDPMKWLKENSDAIDPYGWNGLGHLGLSVNLALRDKTTGLVQNQDYLRTALAAAIADVDQAIELSGLERSETVKRTRHLAIELPLQTGSALRAEDGKGELANSGLGMVQIALRPIPRQVYAYSRFTLARKVYDPSVNENEPVPFEFPHKVDLIFTNEPKDSLRFDAGDKTVLHDRFAEGDTIIVRHLTSEENPGAVLAKALEKFAEAPKLGDLLKDRQDDIAWPLPDAPEVLTNQITPYEKLPLAEDMMERFKGMPVPDPSGEAFGRFEHYLKKAFHSKDENGEAKPGTEPSFDKGDDYQAYFDWSARFFRSAPLVPPATSSTGVWLEPRLLWNVSFAAPKTMDPLRLSPDSQGRLEVTQRVSEEWALTRAYSLIATRRYDALHKAVANNEKTDDAKAPGLLSPGYRADIQLPRVRKLEPPQVLAQRNIQDARETAHFYEVTMATHVEAGLRNSNVLMARKIEFHGVLQEFHRAFAFPKWIEALGLQGAPKPRLPSDRRPTTSDQDYDLSAHRDDYLAHVPQARWGSSRLVTPAAPYYYDSVLRYRAAAGEESSEIKSLPLIRAEAVDPRGLATDGPPVTLRAAQWQDAWATSDDDPDHALFAEKHEIFEGWLSQLDLETYNIASLLPGGQMAHIRAPRFVEGLNSEALERIHVAEMGEHTVGRLPDPDVILQVAGERGGAFNTLAKIASDAADGFVSIRIAERAHVGQLEVSGKDTWQNGLSLSLVVSDSRDAESADLKGGFVPVIPDAATLAVPSSKLLAVGEMPSKGPLSQLLGLAIRLLVKENMGKPRLRMLRPLVRTESLTDTGNWAPVPRAQLRPSLPVNEGPGALPMQPADLGLALVVVADLECRRAAGLLNFDIWRAEKGVEPLRALMARLEVSDAAYVTPPTKLEDFPDALWQVCQDARIELWRRTTTDGAAIPKWKLIEELPDFADEREVLVLATDPEVDWLAAFDEVVGTYGDGARKVSGALLKAFRADMKAFAETVPAAEIPSTRTVYAQRGSRPRVPWKMAEEE